MVKKRKGKIIAALITSILLIVTMFWIINIIIGQKDTGEMINDYDARDRYLRDYYLDQRYEGYYEEMDIDLDHYNPDGWVVDIYELDDLRSGHIEISYSAERIKEPHWYSWNDEDTDDPDWHSYSDYRTIYFLKDSSGLNVSKGDLENDIGIFNIRLFGPQYSIDIPEKNDYRFIVFTQAPDYDITLTYRSDLYIPSLVYMCCILPVLITLSTITGIILLIVKAVPKGKTKK